MAISGWLCRNNTKNMFLRIVYPGGQVQLFDRPIIASELLSRHPKSCVAYSTVFEQPWAVVAPETTLFPGQKLYVVPISTIRRLQKVSVRYSVRYHGSDREWGIDASPNGKNEGECEGKNASSGSKVGVNWKGEGRWGACLRLCMRIKARNGEEESKKGTTCSGSFGSSEENATTNLLEDFKGSPRWSSSFNQWQPRLESIREECSP